MGIMPPPQTTGEFAERVQALLSLHPGSVTSWVRSHDRNVAVGGVPLSWHLLGLAVDVVFDNPGDWKEQKAAAEKVGLEFIHEADHAHIEVPF